MSGLTKVQIEAAQRLLEDRPSVIPGSRVIFNTDRRNAWYKAVSAKMQELGITTNRNLVNQFCEIAGVPD